MILDPDFVHRHGFEIVEFLLKAPQIGFGFLQSDGVASEEVMELSFTGKSHFLA